MKKILFFLLLIGLLFLGNNAFAWCDDYSSTMQPLNMGYFDINPSANQINIGDTVDLSISFEHSNHFTYFSQPKYVMSIDFGDGTTEEYKITDYWQGETVHYVDGCIGSNVVGMLVLECNLSFSHQYQTYGNKPIIVEFKSAAGWTTNYKDCAETTINVYTPCGNGTIDTNEECDGDGTITKTCQDYGFDKGNLTCSSDCKIDSSDCSNNDKPIILPTKYPNPLIWDTILEFLGFIVIYIFRVGTGLAVLMILVGAFVMVTSSGDINRAAKGKQIIVWALIGFVVTMMANGIIELLKSFLGAKK